MISGLISFKERSVQIRMKAFGVLLLAAAFVLLPECGAIPLGGNIDGVRDYSFTLPFVDVMRQARRWGPAKAPWDGNATVGADGWPSCSSFGNVFVTMGDEGKYSSSCTGNWQMSFTGRAVLKTLTRPKAAMVMDQVYHPTNDSTSAVLMMPPSSAQEFGCSIMLEFYNATTKDGPGIKNFQLLQPGYSLDRADDFSDPLQALLTRVEILRFMDWANTNGNLIESWADRTTLSSGIMYTGKDNVPWEVCFRLANRLQKDAWVNIPAHATDDYVTQLAKLALATLVSSL
jgi:hypothetical protein